MAAVAAIDNSLQLDSSRLYLHLLVLMLIFVALRARVAIAVAVSCPSMPPQSRWIVASQLRGELYSTLGARRLLRVTHCSY